MPACSNQIGIRNILITFRDCDNDVVYGPVSHELATNALPQLRLCDYNNEAMPGGYVKRVKGNNQIEATVIRNTGIPLALYQGCAAIDISLEYYNGLVVTGRDGTATGQANSDSHEVTITATFRQIDELLPTELVA